MIRFCILIGPTCFCILLFLANSLNAEEDLFLEDIYEVALGRPTVSFMLYRDVNKPPLANDMDRKVFTALLDTGASASSLSTRTTYHLGIQADPKAYFFDVGVGGEESCSVSEPLWVSWAPVGSNPPTNGGALTSGKRIRFKIRPTALGSKGEGVLGMPVMAGKVVMIETNQAPPTGTLPTQIRTVDEANLPATSHVIILRMHNYSDLEDERLIPPFPSLAHNPVVDQVVLQHQGQTSTATWLLDTGGAMSLISKAQAQRLGLLDPNGAPCTKPLLSLPIAGVGRLTQMPIFQVDRLVLPEASGRKIVYTNLCLGVLDIKHTDPKTRKLHVLDGVLGSNLFCPAKRLPGLQSNTDYSIPFERIVIDFSTNQLRLHVKPE